MIPLVPGARPPAVVCETLRGSYPTPVGRYDVAGACLWVKRDDVTHPLYGGNKVRKLEILLADAQRAGARRIVTIGAAGSHHVLATALFGGRAGFCVEAMMLPQRRSAHVEESLRVSLVAGLIAHPARTYLGAALGGVWRMRGAYPIPMGGSTVSGSMGYVAAARELESQVERGELPEPELIVVTVGSGGTAAGLAAGLVTTRLKSRVLGVVVATPAFAVRALTYALARGCARRAGLARASEATDRLDLTTRYLGDGYGEPTPAGDRATALARDVGLTLDDTYTAKSFAAALEAAAGRRAGAVLYWHTLSSAPAAPLLGAGTQSPGVPLRMRRLLK